MATRKLGTAHRAGERGSRELFYQLSLRFFSNVESLQLEPAPLVARVARVAMEDRGFKGDAEQEAKVRTLPAGVVSRDMTTGGVWWRASRTLARCWWRRAPC